MLFRLYFGSSYYWLNWTFAYDRATRALLIMYMSNFELNKWTFPLCSLHTRLYYNYCQLPQIFSNGSELEVLTVHYATSTNRKQIFTLFRTAHHPQLWQDITRHNTILEIIANWIASNISKDQTLRGFSFIYILFNKWNIPRNIASRYCHLEQIRSRGVRTDSVLRIEHWKISNVQGKQIQKLASKFKTEHS